MIKNDQNMIHHDKYFESSYLHFIDNSLHILSIFPRFAYQNIFIIYILYKLIFNLNQLYFLQLILVRLFISLFAVKKVNESLIIANIR